MGLLNVGTGNGDQADSDQVALVSSQRVGGFMSMAEDIGEPYYANYQRTAVPLTGINRILVKFAGKHKRSFRFQIEPTELKVPFWRI